MELLTFKTLWGYPNTDRPQSLASACAAAVAEGYEGIEGPIPKAVQLAEQFAESLQHKQLHYVAEICTAGSYVPDRSATVSDHVADLKKQLALLGPLQPMLVNCIGGCDAWSLQDSLSFFQQALDVAAQMDVTISFETHRGRSLYSPWVAESLLNRLALPLTCDFSHWCVVCEGLGETEQQLLRWIAGHARHIHGRVGYDQGPQVSDPQSSLYTKEVKQHWQWWRWIWASQQQQGLACSTFTPEFGPDGYQMRLPDSGEAYGDLARFNRYMAECARREFMPFHNMVTKQRVEESY